MWVSSNGIAMASETRWVLSDMHYIIYPKGHPDYRVFVKPDKSSYTEDEMDDLLRRLEEQKASRTRGEGHLVCVCAPGFVCLIHREKPLWETVKPLPPRQEKKAAWDGQMAFPGLILDVREKDSRSRSQRS